MGRNAPWSMEIFLPHASRYSKYQGKAGQASKDVSHTHSEKTIQPASLGGALVTSKAPCTCEGGKGTFLIAAKGSFSWGQVVTVLTKR